ncbi:MAG: hypothetical protein JXB35_00840 [Anaerolineae bacterium]|nr:hypothetical protein [Anaerolineae bacterium]
MLELNVYLAVLDGQLADKQLPQGFIQIIDHRSPRLPQARLEQARGRTVAHSVCRNVGISDVVKAWGASAARWRTAPDTFRGAPQCLAISGLRLSRLLLCISVLT